MAKENYWVARVGVMKLWRGLCQAMDFSALEKGKTMAKEYIEREKALEKVIEVKHHDPELSGVVLHRYIKEIDLKDIPAADVAPVVYGRWIDIDSSFWKPTHRGDIPVFRKTYRCSECGRRTAIAENYCPNCGAKMDKEEK